ncbi:hypothetical protein OXX59_005000 [Metschnikowia pulcherrima]
MRRNLLAPFFITFALASDYSSVLSSLFSIAVSPKSVAGHFRFDISEIREQLEHRGMANTTLHDIFARLPELNMYSHYNLMILERASRIATAAYREGNFGDFFYAWSVMYHDGCAARLNDLTTKDFECEVNKRFGNIPNILYILVRTSTISSVQRLYLGLQEPTRQNKFKRDSRDQNSEKQRIKREFSVTASVAKENTIHNEPNRSATYYP